MQIKKFGIEKKVLYAKSFQGIHDNKITLSLSLSLSLFSVSLDLPLVSWVLLFLSRCLDSTTDEADKVSKDKEHSK